MSAEEDPMTRPAFEPTMEQREQVEIQAGAGHSQNEIAAALEISVSTLRKYFSQELLTGAAKRKAEMVKALYSAGINGNVTAAKAYLAMGDRMPVQAAPAEDKQPKLGKKEQAALDAETAHEGTSWADLVKH
jgi:DNA-binding CsgD family transcriptional regulator